MKNDTATTPPLLEILVVDDNEDDVLLLQESLRDEPAVNLLHAVHDGEEAMAFLRREGPFAAAPRPGLVLLDINMPKMNGIEFLRELRADPELQHVTVVALTTSNADRDRLEAYKMNVAGYLLKPVTFQQFAEVMATINKYWALMEMP